MSRRATGRSPWVWLTVSALAALVAVALLASPTESGWTAGTISNTNDMAQAGALAFTHTGTATCSAGPGVTTTTACSGSIAPTTPTSASGAVTGSDAVRNTGTIAGAGLVQTVQAPSCAPVQLADESSSTDPMLPRRSTSFQAADPWNGTSAVAFTGTAFASDVVLTDETNLLGQNFSIGIWFKVASGYAAGGGLLSLGSSPGDAAAGVAPIALWLDTAGKVEYSIAGTVAAGTGTSAAAYNDGQWHLAILSVATTAVSTPTLYVDNTSLVGAGLTLLTGSSGYWHAGWLDTSTVTAGAPSSAWLTGSLTGGFVTASAQTATSVATLRSTSSATAYRSAVLGTTGTKHLWMFGDSGATTFTGTLPSSMSAPCGRVNVSISATNPAGSVAVRTLAAFADGTARSIPAPDPTTTQTWSIALARGSTYSADIAGLHLYAPLTIVERTSTGAWSLTFGWASAQGVFLA